MNYYLLIDDIREISDVRKHCTLPNIPDNEWTLVRSYNEFVDIVTVRGLPKFVTYDHDLSDAHYGHGLNGDKINYESYTEKTGYDCAKFLVNEYNKLGIKHPPYQVHSMNPVGKQNIISYIETYNKICSKCAEKYE
jgi:hypothetical protein